MLGDARLRHSLAYSAFGKKGAFELSELASCASSEKGGI
jgi:hypothetical protein